MLYTGTMEGLWRNGMLNIWDIEKRNALHRGYGDTACFTAGI